MYWRRPNCTGVLGLDTHEHSINPNSVGLLLGLLFLAAPCFAVDDKPSLTDRLTVDGPSGWKRLEKSLKNASGTIKWSRSTHATDHQKYAPDYRGNEVRRFWLSDSAGKVIIDYQNDAGEWISRKVYCFNADYGFIAAQSVRDGPYLLASYGVNNDDAMTRAKGLVHDYANDLCRSYDLLAEARTLAEIVTSPDFTLRSCVERDENGRALVEAEFSFTPPGRSWVGPSGSPISAKLLLDPSADWRILTTEVKGAAWNRQSRNSYQPDAPPGSMAKMVRHNVTTDGKATDDYSLDFSTFSFETPAASEFRLPSVGLAELSVKRRWGFWRLVLIGGNILIVGIALYFYSRRRERRKVQLAGTQASV